MIRHDFSLEFVEVNIDSRALRFYPLNFKALRVLAGQLKDISNANNPDAQFQGLIKVLTASANRKGKTVTEEELEEMLSVDWANKIVSAVNKISGIKPKEEGLDDPKAKMLPAMIQTGDVSTQQSSLPLDGPGSKLTN